MIKNILPSILAIVVFCSLSLSVVPTWAAKIYRWVDAEGITHYSANAPSNGETEAETLKIKSSKTTVAENEAEQDPTSEADAADSDEASADTENSKAALSPEELAKIKKEEKANCEKARRNLYTLNNRSRIVAPAEEDGTKRYLSDEELAKWKAESSQVVEEFCN